MSVNDLEIAQLVDGIYGRGPAIAWDHLDDGAANDGVYWAIKRQGGMTIVVFRGSTNTEDFARDAEAAFWIDRDLGPVHLGFLQGIKDVWGEVQATINGPWICAGHSLGAARALLLAGLGAVAKAPPAAVVCFGEPRPGFQYLANILAPVPIRSYRNRDANGHDLVTDLPAYLPPFWAYTHPRPLIDVSEPSDPADESPFRWHHMPLYVAAVAKLSPMPST